MSTVQERLQSLITAANAATGNTDEDMTAATEALIAGYGQGKPEQEKTVTVTENVKTEVVEPDTGKVLKKVTVNVNTPGPKPEQTKSAKATDNGTVTVTPDAGKVLSKATVTVDVPAQKPEETFSKKFTENGTFPVNPSGGKVFSGGSVEVAVPGPKPEQTYEKKYTANGTYPITPDSGKVISGGNIEVAVPAAGAVIREKTITENGTYNPPAGVDGFAPVHVNTPVKKPEETKSVKYTTNGQKTVTPTAGKVLTSVAVEVAVPGPVIKKKTITENGTYNAPSGVDGFSPVTVNVPITSGENVEISFEITSYSLDPIGIQYVFWNSGSLEPGEEIISDTAIAHLTIAKNSLFMMYNTNFRTHNPKPFRFHDDCTDRCTTIEVNDGRADYAIAYSTRAIDSGTLTISPV